MNKIVVNDEMCNYLEMLHYETESRKDLIAFALANNMGGTDSFAVYQDEYREFYVQYQIAKSELAKEYIAPIYPIYSGWNLNFSTKEITVDGVTNEG